MSPLPANSSSESKSSFFFFLKASLLNEKVIIMYLVVGVCACVREYVCVHTCVSACHSLQVDAGG